MIDGIAPVLRDIDYLTPSAPYPQTPSGIMVHQDTIYRYAIPTDEQPVLLIEDYISDHNGNYITPGYYQLALSDDREFLYIIESKNLLAIIPVFKIAENQHELNKLYKSNKKPTKEDKKRIRKEKQQARTQEIINKKYAVTGATVPQKYEHMEATIEYVRNGDYYLLMYEKGFIRAWGAIKR